MKRRGACRPLPVVEVLEGSSVLCDERLHRDGIIAIIRGAAQPDGLSLTALRETNIEIPQSPARWPGFVP